MIEVRDVNKSFGNKVVLKNISMQFEPRKVSMIIGESGSGKTTLVKCMLGLNAVDSGQVLYDGRDFTAMDMNERKTIRQEIGMMFQGGALFDSLTVEENVIFPLSMFTNKTIEEKRERANFCLKRVNLEKANNLYPAELSGGMKKRVAIARAIAMNPRYLFCDEPNSGLDPRTSILIDNLIKEITEEYGITTIVITHDMNSVMETADIVFFIYNNKLWWTGSKEEVLTTPNKEMNDFVYASQFMKRFKKI